MNYIKNGEVDIKKLFLAQARNWYLYALALSLFLLSAFLYNRYTIEQYSVLAAVRVEQKSSQSIDPTKILFGGESSPFGNDVEDEVYIIKSFPIVSDAVRALNYGVSYYRLTEKLGRLIEMHEDVPFSVQVSEEIVEFGMPGEFELVFDEKGALVISSDNFTARSISWNEKIPLAEGYIRIIPAVDSVIDQKRHSDWVFTIPGVKEVTLSYIDRIQVSPKTEDSRVLFFSLEGGNPEKERDMLDALLHFYMSDDLRVKNQVASNTIRFIEGELKEIIDSLNTIETRLELFKSSKKISNLSSEASKVFDQLVSLEEQKAVLSLRDKYFQYVSDYMDEGNADDVLVSPESFGIEDANMNQLVIEIIEAQIQVKSIEERGNRQNPVYSELKGRINNLLTVLEGSLLNARAANRLKLQEIDKRLSYIESSMRSFPGSEIQLINIQRLYEISENLYLLLMEKKAEAEISLSSSTSDIRIVEPARMASSGPVSPNKRLIYVIALLAALVLTFGLLLTRDYLNDKVKSKEDITDRLSIPFAGEVVTAKNRDLVYLKENPKSQLTECFRAIRINFNYMIGEIESPVVLITSTIPGEGKTFFSSRLAYSLSGSDKKGIILGADLRKPKLHLEYEIENKEGLSGYLIGQHSLEEVIKSFGDGLDIITSGPVPPNPLELFEKPRFKELIVELKSRYAFVIIDTPPVGLVSEGSEIMKVADLSVFVLRSGYSPYDTLDRITEVSEKLPNNNFAFVLNDVSVQSGYGYYGKYGYYTS